VKVLGICCSPRRNANTEALLQEVLNSAQEAGAEVEMFTVAGKKMFPCDACGSCKKTGKCHIDDDMQPLYEKLLAADGIVFGAPIYFWNMCAQAKIIMDRTYAFSRKLDHFYIRGESERPLKNKVGAAVITTGRVGGASALGLFMQYFNSRRMLYAGGTIGFGTQEDKRKILADDRAMNEAKAVGKLIVKNIKMLARNREAEQPQEK
jgi:multimeric flavodoxin WrbA